MPSSVNDVSLEPGLPPFLLGRGNPTAGQMSAPADPVTAAKVAIGLLLLLFVLAVVFSVLSMLKRRRLVGVGHVSTTLEGTIDTVPRVRLRQAVQEARDLLARPGGTTRDAVIAAWVTLENATEHKREPHQTATEFTVGLLQRENADEAALRELRTLYQRARFGHASADGDADRARDALDRILATIR